MFERYDENARRALFFARYTISERGGRVIAPEHLVHGILRADAQAILRFAKQGTTAETVQEQLEQLDPPKGALPPSREIPFATETADALKRAAIEADDLRDPGIRPEHLMLGVIVTTSGEAARVLRAIGVEVDAVRRDLASRTTVAQPPMAAWSHDTIENPAFEEVIAALHRGDFSRLEPVFARPSETSRLAEWIRAGRFSADPAALNEAATCACFLGQTALLEFLMDNGADPIAGSATGLNGLHWAANRGQLPTVQALIRRGLPLEVRNRYGGTVLGATVWAAVHEPQPTHVAIIETLLAAGASVSNAEYPSGSNEVDRVLKSYGAVSRGRT